MTGRGTRLQISYDKRLEVADQVKPLGHFILVIVDEIICFRLQVDDKNNEVSRLREIAAQLRGDLNTKVAKEINEAENAQRIKVSF